MSKICPLYSSSSGNSIYIGTKNGAILVDAGASLKGITARLSAADAEISEIVAVAVTHEHIDHINGLHAVLNKTGAVLITSAKTFEILKAKNCIPTKTKVEIADDNTADICGIAVSRFATSHDCDGSSGYTFILPDGKKVAVCTDLGVVTNEVHNALLGSDLVLLESNHDVEMLKKGPYPPQLKMRILSDRGHLSNAASATEIKALFQNGTKRFILGHLSQHNNTPLLAKSAATSALIDLGAAADKDYLLSVAKPTGSGVTVI